MIGDSTALQRVHSGFGYRPNASIPRCAVITNPSRIKQYFKEGRALRTETVICDTQDFGIGRRVCAKNWCALRAVGGSANRRSCDAESADALPAPDVVAGFNLAPDPASIETAFDWTITPIDGHGFSETLSEGRIPLPPYGAFYGATRRKTGG